MKMKWLMLPFLSITSIILPMEESQYQAIQTGETHVEKTLEELGLPNEMWAQILELAYDSSCVNLSIIDKAIDIYEAIAIIEKYISRFHATISLVCRTFRDLNISKQQLNEFGKQIRKLYIPYLNEKFLEKREGIEGLYPQNSEWIELEPFEKVTFIDDYFCQFDLLKINNDIAEFISTGNISNKNMLTILVYKYYALANDNMNHKSVKKLIRLLLFYGIDIDLKDDNLNQTALYFAIFKHHALYKNNIKIIKFLLNNGANPNYNRSCLAFAVYWLDFEIKDHIKLITLLLKYGAKPHLKDEYEKDAFDIAKERHFHEFPKLVNTCAQNIS